MPAPYLYSNAGIGLLSYLVMHGNRHAVGRTSSTLRSCGPFEHAGHDAAPRPEQMRRMAKGHLRNGSDAPPWPIYAWYAAGGLRSTARDMLSFGEANLGHTEVNGNAVSAELTTAMQLAQRPIYIMPNGINKQAMAWVNNMGNGNPNLRPVILKNGGTDGFGTVIAINPTKDLAVFVAVNQAGANPTPKGVEIVRHIP